MIDTNQTSTVLHAYTDGGSRGNPGPAAAAWLVFKRLDTGTDELVSFSADYLGDTTNNDAEYSALLNLFKGLPKVLPAEAGKIEIICHLDSELVVKQLRGEYKIKDNNLKQHAEKIKSLAAAYKQVSFVHVPRSLNHYADRLVNICLDAKLTN